MPRLHTVLMLAAAGLLLAACGGSGSNATASAARATTKAPATIALARCMRANGVPNFPDPGASGNGGLQIQASQRSGSGATMSVNGVPVNAPAFQAAIRTCAKDLPGGGAPTAAQSAKLRSAALAMARCMRSHGVANFPDPIVGTGPLGGVAVRIGGSGVDPSSPAFQAASKTCMPLMHAVQG